jgi:hypothetical protein
MRGYLSLVNQQISDPAATQTVHRHRSSLLDLASRDMEDEGEAMDIGKESLKAAKEQFGSIKEKIRAQPFRASQQSLYERMGEIGDFANNAYYRSAVKNGIRDTNKHTHEWIPCQLMADCLRRDLIIGLNPGPWLLLQVHLRTATSGLIFNPSVVEVLMNAKDRAVVGGHNLRQATEFGLSKLYKDLQGQWRTDNLQPGDQCYVLQGHEGAMKATATLENYSPDALDTKGWLSYGSTDFHSQLLYCFDRQETEDLPGAKERRPEWVRRKTQAFLAEIAGVADRWMWDPDSVAPGSPGFALPFKGFIGKGKERKEVQVNTNNYIEWLKYCLETRQETIQMLRLCHGSLNNIYA